MSVSKYRWNPLCDLDYCPGDCDLCQKNREGDMFPSQDEVDSIAAELDQTVKADAGKLQLTLVPTELIRAVAAVRGYGVKKYKDPDNWKRVEIQRYRDAAFRHWLAYLDNPEGKDPESGLPHLWHLACNIAFLCDLEKGE